jgi:aminodeoxyfutalosine synthase
MRMMAEALADLSEKAERGEPFGRAEAARVLSEHDLISIGLMGEAARRRATQQVITFGRVAQCHVESAAVVPESEIGEAGEVRLLGRPASPDEACGWARQAAAIATGVPLTTFSLADLFDRLCRKDAGVLASLARALRAEGVDAVAETPLDRFATTEDAIAAVRAAAAGGLQVLRWTVDDAPFDRRLDLIMRAADVQAATGAARAFAPLPRRDPIEEPSTGYDDVRTVAAARLVCVAIPLVQVDWPLYGPKLAQVAIAFGANDIDGIAPVNVPDLGPRRAPVEDISRQIRAASAVPVERNGRYEQRA